jgi:nucleoside-diphosphate-sugar epimerase
MTPEEQRAALDANLDATKYIANAAFDAAYETVKRFLAAGSNYMDIISHPLFPVYADLYVKIIKGA